MPIDVVTLLKNWPEFMLEPPSQALINHLKQVCEATDGSGQKRYSHKTQIKLVTSVASLGYGPAFYETLHLIGLLARLDIPLTALFSRDGVSSSGFLKSMLSDRVLPADIEYTQTNVLITYSQDKAQFILHFSRIAALEAMIEFIYETIGHEFLFRAWAQLQGKELDKKEIDGLASELSSSMYRFLQDHLPAAAVRTKAKLLSEYLSEKLARKHFHYSDITDALILDFWRDKSQIKKLRLKLYSSCVHSWIRYRQALRVASLSGFQSMHSLHQIIDNSDVDMLEITDIDNSYADLIEDRSTLSDMLNLLSAEEGTTVKYFTKKDLKFLEPFCMADKDAGDLCLTLLRQHIFSPVQSTLVEASRKAIADDDKWAQTKDTVSDQLYGDTLKALKEASMQALELAKVGCLRLWEDKNTDAVTLMMALISDQEKTAVQTQAQALAAEIKGPVDIDRKATQIAEGLLASDEAAITQIKRDFSAVARKFKRTGLTAAAKNMTDEERADWHQDLIKGAETLIELHGFLETVCAQVRDQFPDNAILASQIRSDRPVFLKQFSLLYNDTAA